MSFQNRDNSFKLFDIFSLSLMIRGVSNVYFRALHGLHRMFSSMLCSSFDYLLCVFGGGRATSVFFYWSVLIISGVCFLELVCVGAYRSHVQMVVFTNTCASLLKAVSCVSAGSCRSHHKRYIPQRQRCRIKHVIQDEPPKNG